VTGTFFRCGLHHLFNTEFKYIYFHQGKTMIRKTVYLLFITSLLAFSNDDYDRQREQMVNRQIINRGISHELTIEAMRAVPRHEFVPQAQKRNAYSDSPLPIGYGQTISQPYIVAYMTEIINRNRITAFLRLERVRAITQRSYQRPFTGCSL